MDWPAMKRLVREQFDGLSSEVQSYFDELNSGKLTQEGDRVTIDNLYVFTVQFLTHCCSFLSTEPLDAELVQSITVCCHGYGQLCRIAAVDEARVTSILKTLLYIISKLGEKAAPSVLITLGQTVLETVKSVANIETKTQISDFVSKFYCFLWNIAIMQGQKADTTALQVYQLRLASLRLLAQLPSKRESCLNKLVLVVSVLEQKTRQKPCENHEGVSGGENHQHGKKKSAPQKSRLKSKQEKKVCTASVKGGGEVGSEGEGCGETWPELCVLSSVVVSLDEMLPQGEIPTVPLVKLVLSVYDILAPSGLTGQMEEMKVKVMTLIEQSSCSEAHVLEHMWDIIDIVEHVCEDSSNQGELCEAVLRNCLSNTLVWCRQTQVLISDAEKQSLMELFYWFGRQIKNRKIRSDFFGRTDLVSQLLQVLRESQNFVAENGDAVVGAMGGAGGSKKQEWQEKVSKCHLDAHRCWLTLYHRTLSEHLPSLKTDPGLAQLVSEAEGQLAAYSTAIHQASHCPPMECCERHSLGSMCMRLGHLFYNQGQEETSITYYDMACQHFSLWCQADPLNLNTRIKETSLMKLYSCLCESLMRVGHVDAAMTAIVEAMSLTDHVGEDDLACLMKIWIKLKKAAFREGGDAMETRLARCMVDEDRCSVEKVSQCLQLELNCLLKGARLYPEVGALLQRLHDISLAARDKDVYKLLLLHFQVITNGPDKAGGDDQYELLERITTQYRHSTLLQMEVHLIRFCLRHMSKEVKPLSVQPWADNDDEKTPVGPPVIQPHAKMVGEAERGEG
ncbi:uncharacterized protein LOC143276415 [Babylonia areolata]|uniref:uncharacterized protein LOC143276415 n=1 Tax=Babylonia areolata TaxID=304850 RepID=UPI003FD0A1C8